MSRLPLKHHFFENRKLLLALSGGVDSVVLLHQLKTLGRTIRALHINHHLHPNSDDWADFCRVVCRRLDVDLEVVDIFLENQTNIEENARKIRYHVFEKSLKKDEILLTAHHLEDQAETVLLQLFRGSGSRGLSAMPAMKKFATGRHCRPFLDISRVEIEDYAKRHRLSWIEDASNENTHFRRNFLRLEILPKLREQYPNLAKTLAHSANIQAEMARLADDLARLDYGKIADGTQLRISGLKKLADYRIKNILRFHLRTLGFEPLSMKMTHEALRLINAKKDANPEIRWRHYALRRFRGALYFIDRTIKNPPPCPLFEKFKNDENFEIRHRRPGQRVRLAGERHTRPLKKVLQNFKIPPWERGKLRMYYVGGELCAMEKIGELSDADFSQT